MNKKNKKLLIIGTITLLFGIGVVTSSLVIANATQKQYEKHDNEDNSNHEDNSIKAVGIKFLNRPSSGKYYDGSQVRVEAEVNPSNLTELTYEWEKINGNDATRLGSGKTLEFNVSASDNNMQLKLTVTNKNDSKEAQETIEVSSTPAPQENVIDKVNQAINDKSITIKKPDVDEAEFNSINETTILSLINLPITDDEKNQLAIVEFKKNKPNITFKVQIDNLTSNLITLTYNISGAEPPINDDPFSRHSLTLNTMLSAKSPLEIIEQTKLFKDTANDFLKKLKNFDWENKGWEKEFDGMYYTRGGNDKVYENFYKYNQEVGIVGEYGNTTLEKMMYYPKKLIPQFDMQQRYLPNNPNSNGQTLDVNIDRYIRDNQFGFLPSNLSQFLYYLSLEGIKTVFNLTENVASITMDFDDEIGSAIILINTTNNKTYKVSLTRDNSLLRNNEDFKNFIFDRTIVFEKPRFYETKMEKNQASLKDQWLTIKSDSFSQGTAFIFDRVVNPTLAEGEYEFLVGTNMHVADVSEYYRPNVKSYSSWKPTFSVYDPKIHATNTKAEKTYEAFWDGGVRTVRSATTDYTGNQASSIVREPDNGTYFPHDVIKNRLVDYKSYYGVTKAKQSTSKEAEDAVLHNTAGTPVNYSSSRSNIDNVNFIDKLVWYTPEFTTTGSYAVTDQAQSIPTFDPTPEALADKGDLTIGLEKVNGNLTGTISNAGADFVVTKLVLTRDQIRQMLPSLDRVLDTEREQDWYVGLGNQDNEAIRPSANSTLFVGGYPRAKWKAIKSSSGKIVTQKRWVPNENSSVQFWTRYNEEINEKYNTFRGLVEWFKKWFKSPSMNEQQNAKYMPHGMEIQKILQQSIITYDKDGSNNSEDSWMAHGSSGSMIINSRFELVGVHSELYRDEDDNNSYFNSGLLMRNYTTENSRTFSIPDQVKQKLISENTFTYKINRKN